MKNSTIKLTIENDYDGFFKEWTKELVKLLKAKKSAITEVVVSAGPYRNYGMAYEIKGTTLELDFYSAVRNGFGGIGCTQEEFATQLVENESVIG